jgi:hypothetical protein
MSDNRRIRVFVSSTFRDMIWERDELMTHAWPELRRFCRERQLELVEVDLRWGIAEEQSSREARDHEAFAETRRRTYIGRLDYFEALNRHAEGDGAPLVLLGESGIGKSALIANWIEQWRKAHLRDFIFQHYIGSTPESAEHWRLMTGLVAEIKRWTNDPEELPKSHDDLLKDFSVWLVKARIKAERDGVRCLLVMDALNQLEDRDHGRGAADRQAISSRF